MTKELFSDSLHESIPVHRDIFGKFIGKWSLELTIFDLKGSSQKYNGEWHFFRILEGRAIQDVWIIPDFKDSEKTIYHEFGTTVRVYNSKTEQWKASWTGPIQNQLFVFDIEDDDDTITLVERGNPKLNMKWSFYDITKNSFKWKSEIKSKTTDNWVRNYLMKGNRI